MQQKDPERFAELTRKGGRSVPEEKRSFYQRPNLAREAGRKGGLAKKQPTVA